MRNVSVESSAADIIPMTSKRKCARPSPRCAVGINRRSPVQATRDSCPLSDAQTLCDPEGDAMRSMDEGTPRPPARRTRLSSAVGPPVDSSASAVSPALCKVATKVNMSKELGGKTSP